MSYQALARKWRPRVFADVVGQEHVVQALSNALDRDQVHHAFLFTGTRGVGKTTLARILAKALNCEKGVSATPCEACSPCRSVDEGAFIDLIEVDAASRTKVDDTRDLLDNVQYAPTVGRYKVYLIDEVHMLSTHSFNALLKTLEEPPPHVKFLLATTDPQKLPVTVLSRCLQFNLKALDPGQIVERLEKILDAEGIEAETAALRLLARAAAGSLRDGLSLLDQALAYGGGKVDESMVRSMLGAIEDDVVETLVRALSAGDAGALLQAVTTLAERARDYAQALDELLVQLHNLSLLKWAPELSAVKQVERPWHAEIAAQVTDEDLQLYYQIGLIGKRDLALAPDPRTGFEMVLLRMLAYRPLESGKTVPDRAAAPPPAKVGVDRKQEPAATPSEDRPDSVRAEPAAARQDTGTEPEEWGGLVERLSMNGLVKELAMNLALSHRTPDTLFFFLDPSHEHLLDGGRVQSITDALRDIGIHVSMNVEVKRSSLETPAGRNKRLGDERRAAAERAITGDPTVQAIQEKFGATLIKESIRARE